MGGTAAPTHRRVSAPLPVLSDFFVGEEGSAPPSQHRGSRPDPVLLGGFAPGSILQSIFWWGDLAPRTPSGALPETSVGILTILHFCLGMTLWILAPWGPDGGLSESSHDLSIATIGGIGGARTVLKLFYRDMLYSIV